LLSVPNRALVKIIIVLRLWRKGYSLFLDTVFLPSFRKLRII
jgi:hypothetical protein